MAPVMSEAKFFEASFDRFSTIVSRLCTSPTVTVHVSGREFKLSKEILCQQSPYFSAMFQRQLREGNNQSVSLAELEGVLSVRSFDMLVQWIHFGRVIFGRLEPVESISAAIELSRLAVMCGVAGVDSAMAVHINSTLLANTSPIIYILVNPSTLQHPDRNTYTLRREHILAASFLPRGHAVRSILASAMAEGYIRKNEFKFAKELDEIPGFSTDLLLAVKHTLISVNSNFQSCVFKEPLGGVTAAFDPMSWT